MKQPLLAPLVALAAGIVAARHIAFSLQETLFSILLLAALASLGLRLGARRLAAAAFLTALALAGATLGSLRPSVPPPGPPPPLALVLEHEVAPLDDPVRLRGSVRVPPESLEDADRFVLELESVFRDTPARGGVRVTVYRSPGGRPLRLSYGERVEFLARLRTLRNFENPGAFDRVAYLERQGIHFTATVRAGTPIWGLPGSAGTWWESGLWRVRLWAQQRFEKLFGGPPAAAPSTAGCRDPAAWPGAAVLRAMLLGDRSLLDPETSSDFQRTGTYHALVISGLHIGVLAVALLAALRLLGSPRTLQAAVAMAVVAAYSLLVGARLPVMRAAWMLAAYLLARLVFRQRRALNVIAAVAIGFLVSDPALIADPGFQMSFLSVALIAGIGAPLLENTLEPFRRALGDLWNVDRDLHADPRTAQHRVALRMWLEPLLALIGVPRALLTHLSCAALRVLVWAAELAVISLVIQAGLALPMAVHFQRVSFSGVIANLVVMPLLTLVVTAGLLALLTQWPPLVQLAGWAAGAIADAVAFQATHLPLEVRVPPPPIWLGVLFGFSLLALAWAFHKGCRSQLAAGAAVLATLAVLVWHPFPHRYERGQLELAVIDVGQGESLFLALPDGKTMLLDGGGLPDYRRSSEDGEPRQWMDIGETVVSPYLWSRSVQRLDVVAVSHPDADHLGGVPAILNNFSVGELWLGAETFRGEYENIRALAERRGTPIRRLRQGQTRSLGDVRIEVLGPAADPGAKYSPNDQSLVLRACFREQCFLLTGDIERNGELKLLTQQRLGPQATVLKVAHHGSRTSSQEPFLRQVKPLFAVISAGSENFYGHPHPEALQRLARQRARVLRTDRDGLVSLSTDGRRLFVTTQRWQQLARSLRRPATASSEPLARR